MHARREALKQTGLSHTAFNDELFTGKYIGDTLCFKFPYGLLIKQWNYIITFC